MEIYDSLTKFIFDESDTFLLWNLKNRKCLCGNMHTVDDMLKNIEKETGITKDELLTKYLSNVDADTLSIYDLIDKNFSYYCIQADTRNRDDNISNLLLNVKNAGLPLNKKEEKIYKSVCDSYTRLFELFDE